MIYSSISGRTGIVMEAAARPTKSSPEKIILGESGNLSTGEVPIMRTPKTRRMNALKMTPRRPIMLS